MDITPFKPFVELMKNSADQTGASLGTSLLQTILKNKLNTNRTPDGKLEAGPDDENLEGKILDQGFSDLKKPDGVAKVAQTLWDVLKEKRSSSRWDVLKR